MSGELVSYRLLGVLQSIAPDGPAQERCAAIYREAWADVQANDRQDADRQVAAIMAGALVDGFRHGNWPWT